MELKQTIDIDGFALVRATLDSSTVDRILSQLPDIGEQAGTRTVLATAWGQELASSAEIRSLVEKVLGPEVVAVRGILFDKNRAANWALSWHQDTKIALRRRLEVEGFDLWTEKEGMVHCRPPVEILEQSLAVRIHLDPCAEENGALRVIPGTHRSGFRDRSKPVDLSKEVVCDCDAGDVLLMKPLLLHRSKKAVSPMHRRVVHIEYCSAALPGGLEWAS